MFSATTFNSTPRVPGVAIGVERESGAPWLEQVSRQQHWRLGPVWPSRHVAVSPGTLHQRRSFQRYFNGFFCKLTFGKNAEVSLMKLVNLSERHTFSFNLSHLLENKTVFSVLRLLSKNLSEC